MKIESKILTNLVYDEEYCRKVLPFIKAEYFAARPERVVVEEVVKFFSKFNKPATKDILKIEIGNRTDLSEVDLKNVNEIINGFSKDESHDEWLIQSTEKFCKDRAVYNAILESIGIIDGKDQKRTQESIPNILSDALAVSFDNHVGHDYILDADARYEYYHRKEDKVAFDIELLNKITAGGLSRKSLSCILAQTGGGKSLFMCHVAAATLMQGKNVLYITMEMAEERIAERIDANLLNLAMDELKVVDKNTFDNRMTKLSSKTQGKLIIKEYPTASAHSGHFRALIEELKLKKDFIPDLLVVDYLNICSSARLRMGASVNSYTFIKSIAEELRGLAVEYNIPALTATQVTRSGIGNSDIELTDTSESIALPATLDLFLALIRTEELDELDQIMVKQLKNRYSDPSSYKRFVVGVDWSKMKLYDVEQSAQTGITDSGQDDDKPLFEKSKFGSRMKEEKYGGGGFNF